MASEYKYVSAIIVHDANIHLTLDEQPLQISYEYKDGDLNLYLKYNTKIDIEKLEIDKSLKNIDLTEIKNITFKKVKNSNFLNNEKIWYASWCNKLKYTDNDINTKVNYITDEEDINNLLKDQFCLGYFVKLSYNTNFIYAYIYEKTPWKTIDCGCVFSHNLNDLMYKILKQL